MGFCWDETQFGVVDAFLVFYNHSQRIAIYDAVGETEIIVVIMRIIFIVSKFVCNNFVDFWNTLS